MQQEVTIFWFRRDLRLVDNAGLYHALRNGKNVLPVFIFDTEILNKLHNKTDKRVAFIYECLQHLNKDLKDYNSGITALYGSPEACFEQICGQYTITAVYTNHDYEPQAIARDAQIKTLLKNKGIDFYTFKDQVIFEQNEVLKNDGTPYTVFTPYSKAWKAKLNSFYYKAYPVKKYADNFLKYNNPPLPTLEAIGFTTIASGTPPRVIRQTVIGNYHNTRNIPSVEGTTKLSVHLRFGTVSIRYLVAQVLQQNETLLNEFIWRDFFMMIMYHFPHVVHNCFKPKYEAIQWRNNELDFKRWCEGNTGYPIVDAGMRELNTTGFMHNRVRMITASFLTKHLLIDWRWGELYFAEQLLDYDLALNNGNWQWVAGCGCDAAPYFRVFNPEEQTKKFDPDMKYIRKWVPEVDSIGYQTPIVVHKDARERVLRAYKEALAE